MVKVTRSLGWSQLSRAKLSDQAPSPLLVSTRAKTLPDVPLLSAPCCGRSAAGMGGLPGGRLLGILNPNSAHSNTTWPPDATVAVCVEPQAAHAGIAAPSSRHIASSDCNQRLIVPEPRRAAACADVPACVRAVPPRTRKSAGEGKRVSVG